MKYETYEKIRNEKGYRDSDVARGANVGPSILSDWKRGRSCPKIDKVERIAAFLGVPVSSFSEEAEDAPAPGGSYVSSTSSSDHVSFFTSIDDFKIALERASFLDESQKQRLMLYAQMLYDTQFLEKKDGEADGN